MEKDEGKITFSIMRVKDISFEVNENLFIAEKKAEEIKISINCELKSNIEFNLVIIEIFTFYYYNSLIENKLASITVQNAFNVSELNNYMEDGVLKLPPNFLIALVGMSLSHTRALMSKQIDGTAFNGIVMPVINPEQFARSVFPEIFSGVGLSPVNKENELTKRNYDRITKKIKEKKLNS